MNKQGGWNFRANSLEWVGHNNMDLEYKMGKKIKSPTHINRQKRVVVFVDDLIVAKHTKYC